MRWSGHGDNAVPDPIDLRIRQGLNAKYNHPISSSPHGEAFRAFEHTFTGTKLPRVQGDWTHLLDDGAALGGWRPR